MAGGRADDPDHGVELLWRAREEEPRQGLSTGRIVRAAIELADAEGLEGLSMRKIAERLGFTTMSLYRHVPGRDQLVDLMLDAVYGERPPPPASPPPAGTCDEGEPRGRDGDRGAGGVAGVGDGGGGGGWRGRLEACARGGWEIRRRHPWVAEVRGSRHLPGPNGVAAYAYMLSTLDGTGLTPAQVIATVNLVGRFVDAEALTLVETARLERQSGVSEQEWWGARDSLYERLSAYPTITALWEAGGFDRPEDPFEFGLARVLDGIEALIEQQRDESRDENGAGKGDDMCPMCGTPVERPASGRPRVYCSRACRQRAYRQRSDP
ncbi:TetR family transcriptional regulator [Microtetraspora sp. NBRC 13810]|uniref:TetR/AcrR family transcriptional regulator n=1 Tax=Microtetraspora sp. NBRC 13810 TaxID=3030990 RepID=UPI0024A24584|nr:TetR/AcrR family transcriptional regulator C-terminal domain-containing protein [Microtetraspora sp. NBRC 13810]GLW07263.1 TetR family transcriptional regulator [Microtetraspora sp. NBRC 13810]